MSRALWGLQAFVLTAILTVSLGTGGASAMTTQPSVVNGASPDTCTPPPPSAAITSFAFDYFSYNPDGSLADVFFKAVFTADPGSVVYASGYVDGDTADAIGGVWTFDSTGQATYEVQFQSIFFPWESDPGTTHVANFAVTDNCGNPVVISKPVSFVIPGKAASLTVPDLTISDQPFIDVALDDNTPQSWPGSQSPTLHVDATDSLPIAASVSLKTSDGATLRVDQPNTYSRLGVLDSGRMLSLASTLPGPAPAAATVTLSIVSTKALVVNLFLRTAAKPLQDLLAAFQKGPGALLVHEIKREVTQALLSHESKVTLVRHLSKLLIKFGVNRKDRAWLLHTFAVNAKHAGVLLKWAKDVAHAAIAYTALAHAGVGGVEKATLTEVLGSQTG